jgi:hypothetical protein
VLVAEIENELEATIKRGTNLSAPVVTGDAATPRENRP